MKRADFIKLFWRNWRQNSADISADVGVQLRRKKGLLHGAKEEKEGGRRKKRFLGSSFDRRTVSLWPGVNVKITFLFAIDEEQK